VYDKMLLLHVKEQKNGGSTANLIMGPETNHLLGPAMAKN